MRVSTIASPSKQRYAELCERFCPDGTWRVLPATDYEGVTTDELRFIGNRCAIYGMPTVELVGWVRDQLRGVSAIEVGSGATGLGRHVGIPMTDADVQGIPEIKLYYTMCGQPMITLPPDVERIDANAAVAKYRPHTVIGMWVTQRWRPGLREGVGASVYGIDEIDLLRYVQRYIVIGNDAVHGDKDIMALPHRTYRFPWLRSRAEFPEKNGIYVWES